MSMTRRDVLKGAAAASVAAGAMAGVAQAAQPGKAWDREAGIVIVGAGMGGLSAGVRALQNGIENVTIVEISKWCGGGSAFSIGTLHVSTATGTTAESFAKATVGMNTFPLAQKNFLDTPAMMQWLHDLDLPVNVSFLGDEMPTEGGEAIMCKRAMEAGTPRAYMRTADGLVGIPEGATNFFEEYAKLFVSMGGILLTETCASEILTDNGDIIGLLCLDKDGNKIRIASTQVVLACGGWQGDSEMKSRHLGVDDCYTTVMGTPYNKGTGIKLTQKLGASLQGDFTRWSGVYMAAHPAKYWCEDVEAYEAHGFDHEVGGKHFLFDSCVASVPASIFVDGRGQRYIDEGDSKDKCAVTQTKRGTFLMVCDSTSFEAWKSGKPFTTAFDSYAEALDVILSDAVGGTLYSADTIEELADKMNASGIATHMVNKAGLVRTVNEYNEAAANGTASELAVPRSGNAPAIATPPFYAMPLTVAIYVNQGGLAVDDNARVLNATHRPIEGLYATCPCAGGFFYETYTGAICGAAVTGRWAADAAARALGIME